MFQSSWGQSGQNNQNNQQTPSAFGQPAGGFGSQTGVFGQPQQQSNAFGNPLNAGAVAPASTFGAQPTQNAFGASTGFGATPKPATGFGAFGGTGTSAFGGGNAFSGGNTATGSSIFGQPAAAATTGAFGSTATPSAFGAPANAAGFGAANPDGTYSQVQPVTTGTSNPAFEVFTEKDNSGTTTRYQNIVAMPAYRGCSPEELRVQDYMQGRKVAGAGTSAFGQTAFGAPATTSAFGASAQPQASTSAFGAGGAFGAAAPAAPATNAFGGGGIFGQPAAQPAATGFGAFGATQQPTTSAFGAFGQPATAAPAATSSGIFGAPAAGSSLFGQAKPANTGFGATPGPFGGGAATTAPSIFGGGGFGQTAQPNGGATAAPGAFGTTAGTGAFGGGAFGANNAPKTSIFGTASTAAPTTGIFGQTNNNANTQPATNLFGGATTGGGLFGQPAATPAQQSLFGQPAATGAQPATTFGGGLFGAAPNANQTAGAQPAAQTNIFGTFGSKPAEPANSGGGLFGGSFGANNATSNAATAGGSIFGAPANNTSGNNAFGSFGAGGLFGAKPAAPAAGASGLFGAGASSFGASATQNNQSQQGNLTASIAQPIATNLPIFSMLPQGPRAVPVEVQKKKPGFFVDVPTRSPVPRVGLGYTPASSKLRGFGDALNASSNPHGLSLSRSATPDLFVSRSGSPSLGSGTRQSVKKLVIDKKSDSPEKYSHQASGSPVARPNVSSLFSPAMGKAAREQEAAAAAAATAPVRTSLGTAQSPPPAQRPNAFTANGADAGGSAEEPQEGDYWVKPNLEALIHKGYDELVACTGLVVGRVGYGELHFLEPVDLTGLSRLGALKGGVVRFEDKTCSVYPDSEDVDKPLPGSGLNVRARISLVRCWAVNRATREPIKDANDPVAIKHVKKLKAMKGTHFEEFDQKEGKWVFTVDHF